MPAPVCQSFDHRFEEYDNVVSVEKYTGDTNKAAWVYSGSEPGFSNDQVVLNLGQNDPGTVLSSAIYVWYGKFSIRLKSSAAVGVVTEVRLGSDSGQSVSFLLAGGNENATVKITTNRNISASCGPTVILLR